MFFGMIVAQNSEAEVDEAALKQLVDQTLPQVLESSKALNDLKSYETYRSISEDDLAEYVDFLRSAPAQRFYGVVSVGMIAIYDEASYEFGVAFQEALNAKGI